MNNRRNFYRILHVQPEAPLEIIKASYRGLMTKLKAHPDLGGDHETAVLINQAYAILSDPQRRRQYDEMLRSRKNQGCGNASLRETSSSAFRTADAHNSGSTQNNQKYGASLAPQRCFFCNIELNLQANKFCFRCSSPLSSVKPILNKRLGELFGRRLTPRISKAGTLIIYPSWPHPGYPAHLRDLSPSGISLLTEFGARTGQLLKLESNYLSGVARIVSVRANGANFSVHASLLTVEFPTKTGVFVTAKA
jgi:curved DNA-binding protein CbpA